MSLFDHLDEVGVDLVGSDARVLAGLRAYKAAGGQPTPEIRDLLERLVGRLGERKAAVEEELAVAEAEVARLRRATEEET